MEDHNPMQRFQKWFFEADELYQEREPNAMSLTTIGKDGFPSTRVVLLKQYDWQGFYFFTNYESKKAQDIACNSSVCLSFYWSKSKRQVTVQGVAEKIPRQISDNYFALRPRGSQIGAHASAQSAVIASRDVLETQEAHYKQLFREQTIPRPKHWGGYLVQPSQMEFTVLESAMVSFYESYTLQPDYYWKHKQEFITRLN